MIALAMIVTATTAVGSQAIAHPTPEPDGGLPAGDVERDAHQHGDTAGHLLPEGSSENVDLVSKLKLKNVVPEKIADVGVLGDYAYLAAWGVVTCKYNGVHVVNISDVENPREVAFIPSKEGSYPGEGVQAIPLTTAYFSGDVLVTNNEKCNSTAGFGGMNIYDVTNPERPTPLAVGIGDTSQGGVDVVPGQGKKAANEIHSVFAWDAGDQAYAVIVDNEEGTDVDIIDITNPRKPFLTAEYDLDELFPEILQSTPENLTEVFLHDMVVKEIDDGNEVRQVMLLSYWDAGYVQIDVTDVHDPQYIADSDFTHPDPEATDFVTDEGEPVPPEGNGHQAEFTMDNAYVVGADEDFAPYAAVVRNLDDDTKIDASQGSNTTKLEAGDTIEGSSVFVGRACNGDVAVPAGDPNATDIAVVERGVCTFTEKVANVIGAGGYDAVLIFNRTGSDACNQTLGMSVSGDIPTFGVAPREVGYAIFDAEGQYDDAACLAGSGLELAPIAVGTIGDTLRFTSYFDGWGYVHLFDADTMAELDTYAIPEAHDPAFADGYGDLSVHEVATSQQDPDVLYFSYYAAGFRVAEIMNDEIVETGHYIDVGGNNFWGVQVFEHDGQEYVAASDRDYGLYIFKYTGND